MSSIKISSIMEKREWNALQELVRESHQSISGLLTDAIRDYVRKRRLLPTMDLRVDKEDFVIPKILII